MLGCVLYVSVRECVGGYVSGCVAVEGVSGVF